MVPMEAQAGSYLVPVREIRLDSCGLTHAAHYVQASAPMKLEPPERISILCLKYKTVHSVMSGL